LHDEKNFAVGFIEDINENHTDTTVDFEITLSEEAAKNLQDGDALFKMFKLESSISVTNMTCFDRHRKIRTFKSPEEILFDFFEFRMDYYVQRKEIIMERLEKEFSILDNKVRFILAVISGEMVINNRPKKELMSDLRSQGYPAHSSNKKKDEDDIDLGSRDYDYLLSMPLWNLTLEKVEKLKKQKMEKEDELEDLRATTVQDIWLKDLDELELALDEFDTIMEQNNKRRKRVGTGHEIVSSKLRVEGVYTAERSSKDHYAGKVAIPKSSASAVLSNVSVDDVGMTVDADVEPKVSKKSSLTKKRKSPAKKTSKKKVKSKKKGKAGVTASTLDVTTNSKSEEDLVLPSVKVSATAKTKFTINISDSDDSDEEFGSLMSRIKSRRCAGKPKPKYNFDSDDDEDFEMKSMSSEISSIGKQISDDGDLMPQKKAAKRASKKKALAFSESEDEEDAWSPSGDEDDDDSDFEL
jgi:DNA topoisomerase-2